MGVLIPPEVADASLDRILAGDKLCSILPGVVFFDAPASASAPSAPADLFGEEGFCLLVYPSERGSLGRLSGDRNYMILRGRYKLRIFNYCFQTQAQCAGDMWLWCSPRGCSLSGRRVSLFVRLAIIAAAVGVVLGVKSRKLTGISRGLTGFHVSARKLAGVSIKGNSGVSRELAAGRVVHHFSKNPRK